MWASGVDRGALKREWDHRRRVADATEMWVFACGILAVVFGSCALMGVMVLIMFSTAPDVAPLALKIVTALLPVVVVVLLVVRRYLQLQAPLRWTAEDAAKKRYYGSR